MDRTLTDHASGKDVQRPRFDLLLSVGDTVAVHSMDRLARNLDDQRRIVQSLTQRGLQARDTASQRDHSSAPPIPSMP